MKRAALFLLVIGELTAQNVAQEATLARERDHLAEALVLYRQGVAQNPKWTEGWWYLGTLLYDQDSYADAAGAFEHATALDPKSPQSLAMLGLCEAKLQEDSEALAHLQAARKLGIADDPELRRVVLFTLGSLWLGQKENGGHFDYAQEALKALVREGTESDELTDALGRAVLRISPPNGHAALIRVAGQAEELAAQRGQSARALAKYEELTTAYPKTSGVHFAYGKFLLSVHEDEKAVTEFKRELVNTPDHLLARVGIAGTEAQTDPLDALKYAEEAVRAEPTLPEAHYLAGLAGLNAGADISRVISELEAARRGEPNAAKVYFALGRAYARANRSSDAAQARAEFARLEKQTSDENRR